MSIILILINRGGSSLFKYRTFYEWEAKANESCTVHPPPITPVPIFNRVYRTFMERGDVQYFDY